VPHGQVPGGVVPWLALLCLSFHLGAESRSFSRAIVLLPESIKGVSVLTADKLGCNRDHNRAWGCKDSYPRVNQGGV